MTPLTEVHRVLDDGHECSLQVGILLDSGQPIDLSFEPGRDPRAGTRRRRPTSSPSKTCAMTTEAETAGPAARRACRWRFGTARRSAWPAVPGGGKSTWLRVLMRLAHPTGGRVPLGGVPLDASRARRSAS